MLPRGEGEGVNKKKIIRPVELVSPQNQSNVAQQTSDAIAPKPDLGHALWAPGAFVAIFS